MNLEVIWASGSPYSWRVLLTLELKNLQYKSTLIKLLNGEQKKPEHIAFNPRGKVPVLRDGDFTLFESLAIMAYLDRKYPEYPIFGTSPESTGEIMKVISEFQSYVFPNFSEIVNSAFWKNDMSDSLSNIRLSKKIIKSEFKKVEKHLENNKYLAGSEISAADVFVYPLIQLLIRSESKLDIKLQGYQQLLTNINYPAISAWINRIEELPGYDNTYPPYWKEDTELNHFIS